jgi:hypothetical protein
VANSQRRQQRPRRRIRLANEPVRSDEQDRVGDVGKQGLRGQNMPLQFRGSL